jgi:hypothetical protein
MFIINAPFLFTGIWAIVKVWIDEKTKEKIKILGTSYKKELLEYVKNLLNFRSAQKIYPVLLKAEHASAKATAGIA